MKNYFIYILMNKNNTVNYTGVTSDLGKRIFEHKNKKIKGFTSKYNIDKLVYFEETIDVYSAISREKEIKGWRRDKKISLIKKANPDLEEMII